MMLQKRGKDTERKIQGDGKSEKKKERDEERDKREKEGEFESLRERV